MSVLGGGGAVRWLPVELLSCCMSATYICSILLRFSCVLSNVIGMV